MSDYRQRSHSPPHSTHSHQHRDKYKQRQPHTDPLTRSRSRSPHSRKHKSHEHNKHPRPLPHESAPLSKHDLSAHQALFALYLDIQKEIDIEDLDEREVKGRWKSFVKKWNAGDLAEGWYHPETLEKAKTGTFGLQPPQDSKNPRTDDNPYTHKHAASEDEEEDFGPALPTKSVVVASSRPHTLGAGPTIPSASDILARNEDERENAHTVRETYVQSIRSERKADRRMQKERLDELVPRAESGSRERQLEKKRELAASNRTFAASKDAGGEVELRDADVMGDEDSLGELKRMKEFEQRKRTEREIRREEILRTRAAEREERMRGLREKEAKTMDMLKGIARARFGEPGSEVG